MYTVYVKKMSNENKTIHEFDFNLICEYFLSTERQGPGSPEATLKALGFIDNLSDQSRIADLGCGTGGQTMVLAQHAPGHITGLDFFPGFIDRFNHNAGELNLQHRVKGIVGSMDNLPFGEEELDLIWSEGAIYNIGFERPAEIHDFWMEAYPEIDTIPHQVARIQKAGYLLVASFILPTTCWTDHYYAPLVKAREKFTAKYPGNKTAEELITSSHHEEELYRKYKEFYGYVFYIAKKIKQ